MQKIYHITNVEKWRQALAKGEYDFCSLDSEGFIHCSTEEQVVKTANRIFCGQENLVLLEIDSSLVKPEIKYENLEGGEENFPHIYGPLAVDAVTAVFEFPCDGEGNFNLPF